MKNLLKFQFLFLVMVSLLSACADSKQARMPGTYVKQASSEFSVAHDTLVVEHRTGQFYLIHRKTGFRRMNAKGRLGKREYETEEWNAVYDPETGQMRELRKGRILVFDVKNGELWVGNRRYQRIN